MSHKGKRTDVSRKKGKKGFDGEDLARFKDGDRKSLCLLFMCYWSDKGCMPGRHPGALNPVFTSQIRHNVHKLLRAPRWCRSLFNNLKLLSMKHCGCYTLRLMQNVSIMPARELDLEDKIGHTHTCHNRKHAAHGV